jgi:hypothetical protein
MKYEFNYPGEQDFHAEEDHEEAYFYSVVRDFEVLLQQYGVEKVLISMDPLPRDLLITWMNDMVSSKQVIEVPFLCKKC